MSFLEKEPQVVADVLVIQRLETGHVKFLNTPRSEMQFQLNWHDSLVFI
jgi:hypothetical protein